MLAQQEKALVFDLLAHECAAFILEDGKKAEAGKHEARSQRRDKIVKIETGNKPAVKESAGSTDYDSHQQHHRPVVHQSVQDQHRAHNGVRKGCHRHRHL